MSQTLVDKSVDYISESAQQVARKTSSLADAIDDGAPWLAIPLATMAVVPPMLFLALAGEDRAARR